VLKLPGRNLILINYRAMYLFNEMGSGAGKVVAELRGRKMEAELVL
jgi:hypothetical protein